MKKIFSLIAALLVTMVGIAQTLNVHKTNGEVISIPMTEVSYVDFPIADVPSPPEGVEAVDLGLPSGTKWANMNIGATKPEEFGGYYAWGETEEKGYYGPDNYQRPVRQGEQYKEGFWPISNIAYTQYDVASTKWGGTWHMPTLNQLNELFRNCTWKWTEENGVAGYRVTSKINNKKIFLPAAGYREYNLVKNAGKEIHYYGEYWQSSVDMSADNKSAGFDDEGYGDYVSYGSGRGRSVRPVCD